MEKRLTVGEYTIAAAVEAINALTGRRELSDDVIPLNTYPVADGQGGFVAGVIRKCVYPYTHSVEIGNEATATKPGQIVLGGLNHKETILRNCKITTCIPVNKTESVALTAAEMLAGVITIGSAVAVQFDIPTAAAIIALTPAPTYPRTSIELIIDNSGGTSSGAVTLSLTNSNITNQSGVAGDLVVAIGKVGEFRIYFTSTTTAIIARVW